MDDIGGTKYILADVKKCLGCRCCEQACADANGNRPYWDLLESGIPLSPNINILYIFLKDKNYPIMAQSVCRQCEDAPCVKICPVKAISVNPDGIKVIDKRRCIGCHSCSIVCPFGAVYIPDKHAVATKCTLCIERKGAEGQPACIEACPNGALKLVNTKEIGQEKVKKIVYDTLSD
jgi:Fe-S-cluster-containing dehydrogenase component